MPRRVPIDKVAAPLLRPWRIHRAIGMGGDKLVAHVAGQATEKQHGDDLRAAWRQEYVEVRAEVGPLPGAADLVRHLSGQGPRTALASSGDPQFAREAVDLLEIVEAGALMVAESPADLTDVHWPVYLSPHLSPL